MKQRCLCISALMLGLFPAIANGANLAKDIKKAVERSTLDQPGTKPFHLKATIAPSFERDKASGRAGEVEIWWASPVQWKRELRSNDFHQIEIVNGNQEWQKNEGNYLPQWLEQTATELVKPVPPIDEVLEHAKTAEVRQLGPMTHLDWATPSGTTEVHNILRSSLALQSSTGLLLYAGGIGWGAEFKNYADFHGRTVARTINVGSPQVTAQITSLEDLGDVPPEFFEAVGKGDSPLQTVLVDEVSLRRNLLPMEQVSWPPIQDGPLQGNVTIEIVIGCDGKVKDIGTVVSENSAVNNAGREVIKGLQFKPFLVNGEPVQVMSQFTLPFKTTRPTGTEFFESARAYFERGRHASFPAFGNGIPYVLRAEFEAKGRDGTVLKGHYEDTWLSDTQWRREVSFGNSQYMRTRKGEKVYQLADGPDVPLLRIVMRMMEPIPAIDTFIESDWRIKRDMVNGTRTVRVLAGYESPEGKLDPEQARGYWFDDTGLLVKTYFDGLETLRSEFADFAGVKIAERIDVLKEDRLAVRILVKEVAAPGDVSSESFELKGHEWTRQFTSEVR